MAAQLVAEQAAQQPPAMFDNDDIINIVEDCLENSLTNVSPLLRSVLNTVIESDAEIKERIGPILKQIDQRLVTGASTSTHVASAPTPVSHNPAPGWEVAEQSVVTSSEGLDIEMTDITDTPTQASNHSSVEATGSWTMFDAETWRPCPIGCLPGGILPDLSLPWELDNPPIARVDLAGY